MISARDKQYVRGDLADAREQYAAALRALTDPHATPEEQVRLAQSAIDHADWARYRLDELVPFDAQGKTIEARYALEDIVAEMKPIAENAQNTPFRPIIEKDVYSNALVIKNDKQLDFEFQNLLENSLWSDKIEIGEEMENYISQKPFEEIRLFCGKLYDKTARKWYLQQDARIASMIEKNLSLESQARQAFDLRNLNRTRARDLMYDQALRAELDKSDPNKTFEELLEDKMHRKNISREEALRDIISTAGKTRKVINTMLGLE